MTANTEDIAAAAFIAGWEACDRKWEGPSAAGYPNNVDDALELFELGGGAREFLSTGEQPRGECARSDAHPRNALRAEALSPQPQPKEGER